MVTEVLRTAAHFRNLPEEALARLARGFAERRLDAGEVLYEEGAESSALFVVAEGTVLIFRGGHGDDDRPLARLCRGDLLGTADLFDSDSHSETARALEASVVLRGDKEVFLEFLEEHSQVELNLRLAAARDLTTRAKVALAVAHRKAVRHRVNRKVRVKPAADGAVRATLVDLSRCGMSLRGAPESWQADTIVDYRLEWGIRRLDLSGRIAWRDGDCLGLELMEPSAEQQREIGRMLEAMLRSPV